LEIVMKKALMLAVLLGLAALCGCRSNLDDLDDLDVGDVAQAASALQPA
jgi:hypothetical protein